MGILEGTEARLKAYDMLISQKESEIETLQNKINEIKISEQVKSIAHDIEINGTFNSFINTQFEIQNPYLLIEQIKILEKSISEIKDSKKRFEEK